MTIPYSVAREIHRRVLARMEAEGLERHRHNITGGGYGAVFRGPAIDCRHPFVVVRITDLEARVAADIGQFDSLVETRCRNALMVYRDLVREGPPADGMTSEQRKRVLQFLRSDAVKRIMNEGTQPPGLPGGLDSLEGKKK
jgi:hypothetical protein